MRKLLLVAALCFCSLSAVAQNSYLWRASLVQAAPGKLVELIAALKAMATVSSPDQAPLWMRHSQGDRWDLMILYPMGTYAEYFQPERIERRKRALAQSSVRPDEIAWQEDVFVYGPPLEAVRAAFNGATLFHVEMFQSLPGLQSQLLRQREMENAFSHTLKQPENLIFTRDQGAAWDLFTIGCYRNLKHYAESEDVSDADREAAARAAGFKSGSDIGPYLRTLISLHHDTLAVAIR